MQKEVMWSYAGVLLATVCVPFGCIYVFVSTFDCMRVCKCVSTTILYAMLCVHNTCEHLEQSLMPVCLASYCRYDMRAGLTSCL